jgi:hypothetical protein
MKLKLFTGTAVWVPKTWKDRVTEKPHSQLDVVIVAASKAAAAEMLVGIGEHETTAKGIVAACKLQRDHLSDSVRNLIEGQVLDLEQAGAYVWKNHADNNPIARIDAPGMPIVGYFRYHDDGPNGWHMSAEKVTS